MIKKKIKPHSIRLQSTDSENRETWTCYINSYISEVNSNLNIQVPVQAGEIQLVCWTAGIMIRKLFILGLVLAACLELSQGKPTSQAKTMEDYAEAIIQGACMHTGCIHNKVINFVHAHIINTEVINQSFKELVSGN